MPLNLEIGRGTALHRSFAFSIEFKILTAFSTVRSALKIWGLWRGRHNLSSWCAWSVTDGRHAWWLIIVSGSHSSLSILTRPTNSITCVTCHWSMLEKLSRSGRLILLFVSSCTQEALVMINLDKTLICLWILTRLNSKRINHATYVVRRWNDLLFATDFDDHKRLRQDYILCYWRGTLTTGENGHLIFDLLLFYFSISKLQFKQTSHLL